MRIIATTALLLGCLLVAGAPTATAHGADAREIRALAKQLERATDVLARDARREAGRVDRHEAHALRAVQRLETAADEFHKQVTKRRTFGPAAQRDLRQVERRFRQARHRIDDLRHDRRVRHDLRRIARLLDRIEGAYGERRHFASRPKRVRVAHR